MIVSVSILVCSLRSILYVTTSDSLINYVRRVTLNNFIIITPKLGISLHVVLFSTYSL